MTFSSIEFICVFLPVVFILYTVLSWLKIDADRRIAVQNWLLLITSLVFYAYGEPVYIILLVSAAVVNYLLAIGISASDEKVKKALLAAAVICNIGVLVFYKYSPLLVSSFNRAVGAGVPVPEVRLPIGISFYTFQALSYIIDVYRGQTGAQKNLPRLMLYISFFPQLIAGPIIKYHDIDRQLTSRLQTLPVCAAGMKRFCFGLAKKVLIANTMAVAADGIFGLPTGEIGAAAAWTGAAAYMLQIYFDFSGYSDMAIGMGGMFGFTINENFMHPYMSGSIKEFWRRWHISLSAWFREYLYIPLGGNRRGNARTTVNKFIVFALTGLWHGPNWTFLVWGLYHGALLMAEDALRRRDVRPFRRTSVLGRVLGHAYVLIAVCIGFVIFRADSLPAAFSFIGSMFGAGASDASAALTYLTPVFIAAALAGVIFSISWKDILPKPEGRSAAVCSVFDYAAAACLLFASIVSLSGSGYNPFIYFRF